MSVAKVRMAAGIVISTLTSAMMIPAVSSILQAPYIGRARVHALNSLQGVLQLQYATLSWMLATTPFRKAAPYSATSFKMAHTCRHGCQHGCLHEWWNDESRRNYANGLNFDALLREGFGDVVGAVEMWCPC